MTTPQSPAKVEVGQTLPELPESEAQRYEWESNGQAWVSYSLNHVPAGGFRTVELYTSDQMRAYATEAIAAERAEVVRLREELNLASVGEFGAQSANRHLSALVDFERQISERCMAVMKALMDAAEPVNNEFQDCHIDYADYAKFVDAHAEMLYVIKNGERPALATTTQGENNALRT